MAVENSQIVQNIKSDQQFSNFSYLYKARPSKEKSQEIRRLSLLDQQKKKRQSLQDNGRILELVRDIENLQDSKNTSDEKSKQKVPAEYFTTCNMPFLKRKKNTGTIAFYFEQNKCVSNKTKPFRDQLMFSEWMEELPSNFENDWLMIPCPEGFRMLVVACKGSTKAYTKKGKFRYEFQSDIPGGGRRPNVQQNYRNTYTILDCIYSPTTETFYILDLLAWGNQPFTDCETEFRLFWLKGKLSETEKLSQKDVKWNLYPFVLLPSFTSQEHSISSLLSQWPLFANNVPPLDGLLFYHKNAHYTSGLTPTVLWLLPFMVPEVINPRINIHSNFMAEKPIDYQNQQIFIQNFEQQKQNKARRWKLKTDLLFNQMELESTDGPSINDVDSGNSFPISNLLQNSSDNSNSLNNVMEE